MWVHYNPSSLLTKIILYVQSMHSFRVLDIKYGDPSLWNVMYNDSLSLNPDHDRACLERTGREGFRSWRSNC